MTEKTCLIRQAFATKTLNENKCQIAMSKENRELLSERLAEVSRWLENDAQRLERLWLNDKYWTTGFGYLYFRVI